MLLVYNQDSKNWWLTHLGENWEPKDFPVCFDLGEPEDIRALVSRLNEMEAHLSVMENKMSGINVIVQEWIRKQVGK